MTAAAARATRRLTDREGKEWLVWEEPAGHVPGSRGDSCLICDSWNARRRIWEFPDDWQLLGDDELLSVCHAPVSARSRVR
jgi:hypothetical protein